jgi:hypothetical protein
MNWRLTALILLAVAWLSGCDRFRYPCQDPENWEKKECKRPYCSSTGTCPDQLVKPEDAKVETNEPPKTDKPIPCADAGAARCGN